ncbi:hypothetical protein [Bacillus sp. AG4(2022)]|uniref:hypothetical protein n=1 Tax=Bacillus sp. AG4(2022) TaxID=2962594 RepID=UPI002880E666|nr:hypothetical protein [Bacillus sp. AG4(2022)]MDT0160668.1 hypothetical protein [Bacillus sp. AG4(2022)]
MRLFHGGWSLGYFLGHGVWSHLAIDTEFHVKEGQIHELDLGTVDGKEVQEAIEYVSNLSAENELPEKMVIVHQFADKVLINKDSTQPTDNTVVVINFEDMDWMLSKEPDTMKLYKSSLFNTAGSKSFIKRMSRHLRMFWNWIRLRVLLIINSKKPRGLSPWLFTLKIYTS